MWPDRRLLDLFEIELPIVLAPMAGAMDWELAAEAAEAGACGSLPCAMLSPAQVREQFAKIRERTQKPVGFNFFLPHPAGSEQCARARVARTAQAVLPRACYRSLGGGAIKQPRA